MNRAERRRLEREARKEKVSVDSYYMHPAVNEALERQKLAEQAARFMDKFGSEMAAEKAYWDCMRLYDEQFSKAIVISCAMMLKDFFPRWHAKAIEKYVQRFMDYMDMYGDDYKYDIGKFKDLYAITFGEPLIMTHEPKKPVMRKEKIWKN